MDDLSERLRYFNKDRLPEMVQLKYRAMKENLFRFYRGSNHIFYEDLLRSGALPASPLCWLSGDLHLENFGSYKGDNRLVYFDLNDFDEALLAPCWLELARIVTSIFVAFESLQIEQKKALHMAQLFIKKYAAHLAAGKSAYIERQTAQGIVKDFLESAAKRKQKEILEKRTISKKNRLEIMLDDPRHFELKKDLKSELFDHIAHFLKHDGRSPYNYKVIDGVFRLAGTGSIGMKRYAFLLKSSNEEGEKYLLIDMKQSSPPAIARYCPVEQPAWSSDADRIVAIQTRMQNRPPALLSTTHFRGDSFVIQEMQPVKDSINFKLIKKDYRAMCRVIEDMAMLTASAQLRSGGQQGSAINDELVAFGHSVHWQEPLLDYAISYSHQVRKDYLVFLHHFNNGVVRSAEKESAIMEPKNEGN